MIFLMTAIFFSQTVSATDLDGETKKQVTKVATQSSQTVGVSYHTHVQNVGWEPTWVTDERYAGTEGEGLRLEGIEIKLSGNIPTGAKIEYRTHVQNQGWEKYWSLNGNASGSQGMSQRLEGIQIRLVNMPGYSVEYRTHIQNQGWEQNWAKNGSVSGTVGQGLRLESIQIRIVKENADLTEYQEILARIKNAKESDYTTYSWNNLQSAVKANVVTVRNTQEEVDQAATLIDTAFRSLESEAAAKVYETSGTYGPATGQELISQNVVIKADGVTLQNLRIRGDLIVSEEVGLGNVTLNNVTVDGETYIRGGGKNSIHINGGNYQSIIVQQTSSGKVRIVATNSEGVDVIIAEDADGEEIILEGIFASVQVDAPGMKITTQGKTVIDEMTLAKRAAGSQVNLDANTQVDQMVINGKTAVKGQGKISKAEVNADNVTYERKPDQQTVGKNVKIPPKAPPILVTAVSVDSAGSVTTLTKGRSLQMSATVTPSNAENMILVWSVINDSGTASISSSGLLTANTVGTVTVKATAQDGSGICGTKQITITEIKAGVIATASVIAAGATNPNIVVTLTEDTFTANASMTSNWTTSMGDTSLTVNSIIKDSDTQVTIKTTGTAVPGTVSIKANVLALTKGLASNTVSITEAPVLMSEVMVTATGNVTTVTRGNTLQMAAAVLPANATNKNTTWSVINGTGAATVSSLGLLTPTTAGTITVKATAQDASGKYGTMVITVLDPTVATLSTTTSVVKNSVNPSIVVTLINDTFTTNADSLSNWTTNVGNTGLKIIAVSRDSDRQVTVYTSGTSAIGTISFLAKVGALTKGTASNTLSVPVSTVAVMGIAVSGTSAAATITQDSGSLQMLATVAPANASNTVVTWSVTNNTGAATISNGGLLSAVRNGTVTVTATAQDGSGIVGSREIIISGQTIGTITSTTTIENGSMAVSIEVYLTNDVFTTEATKPINWTLIPGAMGLSIDTITKDSDNKITIKTKGMAAKGNFTLQAGAAALAKGGSSNVLSMSVTGVTNFASTEITDKTASFSWSLATGATSVKIQQSPKDMNSWTDSNTGTLSAATTGATVSGLIQLTGYDFRLVVVGGSFAGLSNVLKGIKTDETVPDYVSQVLKGSELTASGGAYSAAFTWRSNQGVGTNNPTTSGSYTYYQDGAYLRFQVVKVLGDGSVTVMKFCDVFETGAEVNDTVGGMTLQTGTGTVCDMDGSFRERADWGLTGYSGYETGLPNGEKNYLFYGVIQKVDYGTKTVGFGINEVRNIAMILTPKTGLTSGIYRVMIETKQQGAEESENGNLISYDFSV